MTAFGNPALAAFSAQIGDELVIAQVVIRHIGSGYELRHVDDRLTDPSKLTTVRLDQMRRLAQLTADGAFRPLKAAPSLRAGWRVALQNEPELEFAIQQLYPGALADWWAARAATPPVTHYREFTNRQTGMYRITTKLTDAQAARVIQAGCHRSCCLKRRLWTVAGLDPDEPAVKSIIPCLEPCAILLELARKVVRAEQSEKPI
jgi:hypothetical protein